MPTRSANDGNGGAGGQSGRPALLQASHYKDGILMNPSKVMGKLVRYVDRERTLSHGLMDLPILTIRALYQGSHSER